MIPLSGRVLLVAALVCSPAVWATAVSGELPLEVALTRYLLVVATCWVLLSAGSALLRPVPASPRADADEAPPPS